MDSDHSGTIHYKELLNTTHFRTFLHDVLGIDVMQEHEKRMHINRQSTQTTVASNQNEEKMKSRGSIDFENDRNLFPAEASVGANSGGTTSANSRNSETFENFENFENLENLEKNEFGEREYSQNSQTAAESSHGDHGSTGWQVYGRASDSRFDSQDTGLVFTVFFCSVGGVLGMFWKIKNVLGTFFF